MANNLFISYDLIAPGQHYPEVIAAIQALGAWAKVHYSLFYVKTTLSASEAATKVRTVMDSNDKLIVIDAKDAYWYNLPKEVEDQIKQQWNR